MKFQNTLFFLKGLVYNSSNILSERGKEMKKLSLLALSTCVLCACTNSVQKSETTINQVTTTTTNTVTTTMQKQENTTTTTSKKAISETIDYEALQKGDFSSVSGKWRNKKGQILEFNDKGFVDSDVQLNGFVKKDGILYAQVASKKTKTGYALNFVKKGTTIPNAFFFEGSDTSDVTKDRLFGAQALLTQNSFDPFYRVEE